MDNTISGNQSISEREIVAKIMGEILKSKLNDSEKTHIQKIFAESYQGIEKPEKKIQSSKSFKDLGMMEGNYEANWTLVKQSKVIIICGKASIMKDVVVEEIVESTGLVRSLAKTLFISINQSNFDSFLGRFDNHKWVPGVIPEFY